MTTSQVNLEIKTKLDALQSALLSDHPQIPTLLRDIHTTLKNQPDQVTLLSEEEVHIVVQGLEKQTRTHLAAATTKTAKSTKTKESLKNVKMDDLF